MSTFVIENEANRKPALASLGLADRVLAEVSEYQFDITSVKSYASLIKQEITAGIEDLKRVKDIKTQLRFWSRKPQLRDQAMYETEPVKRDQAVWNLASSNQAEDVKTLMASVRLAPSTQLAISALLALQKISHHDPHRVQGFLTDLATNHPDIELSEWAKLHHLEMLASLSGDYTYLHQPASTRAFKYVPGNIFDVTMPLIFNCQAYTKVGPTTLQTIISPSWFEEIFGQAMACLRQETFNTNLVLEKLVPQLHLDGSAHYEHFPFSGTTEELSNGVHHHNYWAQLYRPFYTSGQTEVVTSEQPVILDIPMTFCRRAITCTPEKYSLNGKPIPESVRGIFFGYGHIQPKVFLNNGFALRAGDFQLSSKVNPATGELANTYFFGTFFGKLSDWDGDGELDVNTRPVHCNAFGDLDYLGDGSMQKDPVRPKDWCSKPQPTC